MKERGLVVKAEDVENGISFKESWNGERIDKFMHFYFPSALDHQQQNFRLRDGQRPYVALTAERKKLFEFEKSDEELNGRDLAEIRTGKGKDVRESTLYFGQVILPILPSVADEPLSSTSLSCL